MPKRAQSENENSRTTEVIDEVEMMMEKMLENLLTAQEAAELLGTNASRVRQLILEKRISAVKKGAEWIVYKPSVKKYIKTRRMGRPPKSAKLALDKY